MGSVSGRFDAPISPEKMQCFSADATRPDGRRGPAICVVADEGKQLEEFESMAR